MAYLITYIYINEPYAQTTSSRQIVSPGSYRVIKGYTHNQLSKLKSKLESVIRQMK